MFDVVIPSGAQGFFAAVDDILVVTEEYNTTTGMYSYVFDSRNSFKEIQLFVSRVLPDKI